MLRQGQTSCSQARSVLSAQGSRAGVPTAALAGAPATGTEGLGLRQLESAKEKIHWALGGTCCTGVGRSLWLCQLLASSGGAPPPCGAWEGSPVPERSLQVRAPSPHRQCRPGGGMMQATQNFSLPLPCDCSWASCSAKHTQSGICSRVIACY